METTTRRDFMVQTTGWLALAAVVDSTDAFAETSHEVLVAEDQHMVPWYMGITCLDVEGEPIGRIVELDLDTFDAVQTVGFTHEGMDKDHYAPLVHDENVSRTTGKLLKVPVGHFYRYYSDGRRSMSSHRQTGNAPGQVVRRIKVEKVIVYLTEDTKHYASLIHPNCEIRFE